jgi:hypothetical protein
MQEACDVPSAADGTCGRGQVQEMHASACECYVDRWTGRQAGRHSNIYAACAAGHQDKLQVMMPQSVVPDVTRCQKNYIMMDAQ